MRSDSATKLLPGTSCKFCFSWNPLFLKSIFLGGTVIHLPTCSPKAEISKEIISQPKGFLHTMSHPLRSTWYTLYLTRSKPWSHKAMRDQTKMRILKQQVSNRILKPRLLLPTKSSGTDSTLKFLAHTRTKGRSLNHGSKPTPPSTHTDVSRWVSQNWEDKHSRQYLKNSREDQC